MLQWNATTSLTADVLKTEREGADHTFDITLSPSWTLLELNRREIEMARPLRIEYAGALYHVTARGNARANIYANDDDRQGFLSLSIIAVDRYEYER